MQLEGGITVQQGERRRDQPFRVGIVNADGADNDFWTNEPDDATCVFAICVRRLQRQRKP